MPHKLGTLTRSMARAGVLDAVGDRTYGGAAPGDAVKRGLLFGRETRSQMERMRN